MNKRIMKLVEQIKEEKALVLLFSGKAPLKTQDQYYPFRVNSNFFYMSGLKISNSCLLIEKTDANKYQTTLYVVQKDALEQAFDGKNPSMDDLKNQSGVDRVASLDKLEVFIERNLANNEAIYIDCHKFKTSDGDDQGTFYAKKIASNYPWATIKNSFRLIAKQRYVKDENEIENIKKAISATKHGLNRLMEKVEPGINERLLEAHYDFAIKEAGIDNTSFNTIAAAGINATTLHYVENNCECKDGDLILFDLGCEYDVYCSDITRTYPINGKFSARQKELYDIVLSCNEKMIDYIRPGMSFSDVDNYARSLLTNDLKRIGLIKEDSEITKYYMHSIGHPLGLDVHDVGRGFDIVEGMVMTVEPGLYIEEESIGIRIEDDVLVTKNGCINLSSDIIKTTEEIEAYMAIAKSK